MVDSQIYPLEVNGPQKFLKTLETFPAAATSSNATVAVFVWSFNTALSTFCCVASGTEDVVTL